MKTYNQAIDYLNSFTNYELTSKFDYSKTLSLLRVKKIFTKLDIPYKKLNVIHVAGTKGKGSCSHFLASILAASGYKVGLHTSPHFFDLRERIKIMTPQTLALSGRMISKKDLFEILSSLKKKDVDKTITKLTYFEVLTAIAFRYFKQKKVDYVILETGLGGRLDATNVVSPIASIITDIDYDHTHILGNTLEKIAQEKCGIIKKNALVFSSNQNPDVLSVIKVVSKKNKIKPIIFKNDFDYRNLSFNKQSMTLDFKMGDTCIKNLKTNIIGAHQAKNLSLALATLIGLKDKGLIGNKLNYKKGVKATKILGRFEILKDKPFIIADVAHNPSSFKTLNETITRLFPKYKLILIFGACRDKDIRGMLKAIKYDKIVLTSFNNERAFLAKDLKARFPNRNTIISKDIRQALNLSYKHCSNKHLILIAGSFFLVAESKKILN